MKSIAIAYLVNGELISLTQTYNLDDLVAELTEPFNEHYGIGNWLCCPADDLPADFNVENYTIADGKLVKSTEI